MSHEVLNQQLHAEVIARPAYADAEEAVVAIEHELSLAFDQIGNGLYVAGDVQQATINTLQDRYETACKQSFENGLERPLLGSFIAETDNLPEDYRLGVLAYDDSSTRLDAAEAELETHVPEKTAEVQQSITKLLAEVDYDALVTAAFADDDRPMPAEGMRILESRQLLWGVSRAIGVSQALAAPENAETFAILKSLEANTADCREEWREKGLLLDKPVESSSFTTEAAGNSVKSMEALQLMALKAQNMRLKYKDYDPTITPKLRKVNERVQSMQLADPAVSVDQVFITSKLYINNGLTAAMLSHVEGLAGEVPTSEIEPDTESKAYAQLVEEARAIDPRKALELMEISGAFEDLPFDYSEAELKEFLLEHIPPLALAQVRRLEFRPLTPEEDAEDNTLGFHRWSNELGGSEIVISDAKVRAEYEQFRALTGASNSSDEKASGIAKNSMLGTLVHEFGHAFHRTLPVAALQRWDDLRSSDPTNVTAYVKDRYDTDHQHRYKEDFADTMRLFVNQPYVLNIISPARFTAMQQLFEDFKTDYSTTMKYNQIQSIILSTMITEGNGETVDDIKAIYLWHERVDKPDLSNNTTD